MRPAVSVARSLTCTTLLVTRRAPTRQIPSYQLCPISQRNNTRPFSLTPCKAKGSNRSAETDLDVDDEGPVGEGVLQDKDVDPAVLKAVNREAEEVERSFPSIDVDDAPPKRLGIFAEDEEDDELATEADDEVADDAITSMAHTELEEHRELREYARIIAWDMPSLSSFAQPFTVPADTHVLRFRYTTYMGESHPAEPKVVMELCTEDLTPKYLTQEQRTTLIKLLGPRYNPETDIVHMSCEKFPTSAQNKRYLGDLINTLITEAKQGDSFADVPQDTRHHKPKPKAYFPSSWVMTEERKAQLQAIREGRKQAELERINDIVDGNEAIESAQQAKSDLFLNAGDENSSKRDKVTVPAGSQARNKNRRFF